MSSYSFFFFFCMCVNCFFFFFFFVSFVCLFFCCFFLFVLFLLPYMHLLLMAEFSIIFSRQFLRAPECLLFLPGLLSMLQPSACCSLQYILIYLD